MNRVLSGTVPHKPRLWVERWASLIPPRGRALDVACGDGRHAAYLVDRGHPVDAVDIDLGQVDGVCRGAAGVTWLQHDLEHTPWPFEAGDYQCVLVSNYLYRPLFPHLIAALASGGILIYTSFSMGQERYGHPRNPAHLLMPGELLEVVRGQMRVVAYEDILEAGDRPARVQRLCAIKN